MLKSLFFSIRSNEIRAWFLFHVLLGVLSLQSKVFVIIWFYTVLVLGIFRIITRAQRSERIRFLIYCTVYLSSLEIISRIVNATPIIPYEIGKYLIFAFFILGIVLSNVNYWKGLVIMILLLPGIVYGYLISHDFKEIVFNAFGVVNFSLGVVFFTRLKVMKSVNDINAIVRLLGLGLLVALVYVFFRTPEYAEIDFTNTAIAETSAGFGSNQISTVFGLGLFLVFYLWYSQSEFSGLGRIVDISIFSLFFFQGLLTFSRGGIIGGVLGIVALLFINQRRKSEINGKMKIGRLFFIGVPAIVGIFIMANSISDGNLSLRYQGETAGTLSGLKEKNLNTITTSRSEISEGDIDLFLANPIFGVGVGESKELRKVQTGVITHVEFSRLLAEHGILGMIVLIMVLWYFIERRGMLATEGAVFYILAIVAFYTTFHAATRTFMSPILMSLMCLQVAQKKKTQIPNAENSILR